MSSEATLRIILLIVGLFILGGIVLHDYYTRRNREGATRRHRREPKFEELDLPLAEEEGDPAQDWGKFEELNDPPLLDEEQSLKQAITHPQPKPAPKTPPLHVREAGATERKQSAQKREEMARDLDSANKPERIFTLYVKAKTGRQISGVELLDAAIKTGLQFGERKIFHRTHEGSSEPIFSMANLVKPGFFDPGAWNVFETPGVALFMTLPGPEPALDCWDAMHAAGQRLAELLNAELLDDSRCRMSRQRIAQLREAMREYDRRMEIKRSLDHGV